MDKTALVTGGNSGIGYATAKLLKEKGYTVFISGRNADAVQQAAEQLGVQHLIADMSKPEEITQLAAHFSETGLDALVNNAGMAKGLPIDALAWEDLQEIFSVNVWGPLFLIKELLPALEKKQGSISMVSSVVAEVLQKPGLCLYSATKGAVNGFTRNLVMELTPRNIRINAVAPGPIDTPMFTKVTPDAEVVAAFKQSLESTIPMSRLGKPEEVAQVIVAQLEATYVTGAVWTVDGGVSVV